MRLAPAIPLNVTRAPAPSGVAGVFTTLRHMREGVESAKGDPFVIATATGIIYTTPERDTLSEVTALFNWVRDHVRYVRDPHGLESLSSPAVTAQRMTGDCDDQTALLCALFESVGYPTRFVMAAYNAPGQFEHVYCQVYADNEWIDADPTERQPLGYSPPGAISIYLEG